MPDTEFHVIGPFDIPTRKPPRGGRRIDSEQINQFWDDLIEDHPKLSKSKGCYIFGMRNGASITPEYIGKTTNQDFRREACHKGNLNTYNDIISGKKGTPVFFFLLTHTGHGRVPHIDFLEVFLIQNAVMANPKLKNVQRSGLGWKIAGVLRSDGGQPSKSAQAFRKMMHMGNLKKTRHEEHQNIEGLARLSESSAASANKLGKPSTPTKVLVGASSQAAKKTTK